MSKLSFDKSGEHFYETGVSKGVLYVWDETKNNYGAGVAWNGLTGVTESPTGADETALYADDIKYLSLRAAEEFGATITAYTYPKEFMECDGSMSPATGMYIGQQTRKKFCFCYQTIKGNDTAGNDYGIKLHIIYGCTASPSDRDYSTVNDSPEAIEFSWEITTQPIDPMVSGGKVTSTVTLDVSEILALENGATIWKNITDKLYGSSSDEPTVLLPYDIASIIRSSSVA